VNYDDKKAIDRIFELLDQKGIKPSKMAEDLRFSTGLASQWKAYLQKPSINKIKLIAPYLNVTIPYLLNGSEEPNVTQIIASRIKEIRQQESPVYDDEALEYLDELRNRPEMRMLFKTAKKSTKEDIERTVKIIEALKGSE
jgi:transcriptional regulator with XRE-family HTH domain